MNTPNRKQTRQLNRQRIHHRAPSALLMLLLAACGGGGGGGSGGIGQMMFVFYAYNVDLNAIVVCMIVVGLVALAIDRIFRFAENVFIPWRH